MRAWYNNSAEAVHVLLGEGEELLMSVAKAKQYIEQLNKAVAEAENLTIKTSPSGLFDFGANDTDYRFMVLTVRNEGAADKHVTVYVHKSQLPKNMQKSLVPADFDWLQSLLPPRLAGTVIAMEAIEASLTYIKSTSEE